MSTGIAIIHINTINIISENYKPIPRWCKKKKQCIMNIAIELQGVRTKVFLFNVKYYLRIRCNIE